MACLSEVLLVGGGNRDQLSCLGEHETNNARQLQRLAGKLGSCQHRIETACSAAHSLHNLTARETCDSTIRKFRTQVKSCLAKNGCSACHCWARRKLSKNVEIIQHCSLRSEAMQTVVAHKNCRNMFSACRRSEDESIGAIAACGRTTESLLLSAKRLKYNFVILGKVSNITVLNFFSSYYLSSFLRILPKQTENQMAKVK